MHVLVLGGTRFAGRFVAERAMARGHRVTLFHRWHLGAILHRNIDACCNGQQKPYTIACAVLLQRHT